ncbi:hypothetical protein P7K49_002912 [Saguinus oedipus]|uniref:Uncharacterized protein n=1 Tax=Saguinus oedipus TaxID=9490 RepID=A0ABQ9WIP0_SAGOE|nr:hypothetical protein P7K49_002912 [Saguinus oedipus]
MPCSSPTSGLAVAVEEAAEADSWGWLSVWLTALMTHPPHPGSSSKAPGKQAGQRRRRLTVAPTLKDEGLHLPPRNDPLPQDLRRTCSPTSGRGSTRVGGIGGLTTPMHSCFLSHGE